MNVRVLAAAMVIAASTGAVAAPQFTASSTAFRDGDELTSTFAFNGADASGAPCGGSNVSPPIAWQTPPAGTRSFAVIFFDVDGAKGTGTVHWLAYDLAASVSSLAQGAGNAPSAAFSAGKTSSGALAYRGYCPPLGDAEHHYVMTVYALDLEPGVIPAGLERDALLKAMSGHILRSASIVGRYRR